MLKDPVFHVFLPNSISYLSLFYFSFTSRVLPRLYLSSQLLIAFRTSRVFQMYFLHLIFPRHCYPLLKISSENRGKKTQTVFPSSYYLEYQVLATTSCLVFKPEVTACQFYPPCPPYPPPAIMSGKTNRARCIRFLASSQSFGPYITIDQHAYFPFHSHEYC